MPAPSSGSVTIMRSTFPVVRVCSRRRNKKASSADWTGYPTENVLIAVSVTKKREPRPLIISPGYPVQSALRSEEHTSELQSHSDLVCRLLLEKKKQQI